MFLVAERGQAWDFAAAFARLQAVVLKNCTRDAEDAAKIAAGVREALDFAAENPDAARALLIDAHSARPGDPSDYRQMIEFFGRLLGTVASPCQPRRDSLHEALVGSVAGIVGDHVRTGKEDRLREIAPELIQLILLPYVGFDDAKRWANHPADDPDPPIT